MDVVLAWLPGVALAGAVGAVVRHLVTARAARGGAVARAWAVAGCNLAGAAILAATVAIAGADPTTSVWLLVLGSGFSGALTTFSTWVADAVVAALRGERRLPVVVVVDLAGQLGVGVLLALVLLG